MRKITQEAVEAFMNDYNFSKSNTQVVVGEDHTTMYLHGNAIARTERGVLEINMQGWGTPTTRERLNGLLNAMAPECYVRQHKHVQELMFLDVGTGKYIVETNFTDDDWYRIL